MTCRPSLLGPGAARGSGQTGVGKGVGVGVGEGVAVGVGVTVGSWLEIKGSQSSYPGSRAGGSAAGVDVTAGGTTGVGDRVASTGAGVGGSPGRVGVGEGPAAAISVALGIRVGAGSKRQATMVNRSPAETGSRNERIRLFMGPIVTDLGVGGKRRRGSGGRATVKVRIVGRGRMPDLPFCDIMLARDGAGRLPGRRGCDVPGCEQLRR